MKWYEKIGITIFIVIFCVLFVYAYSEVNDIVVHGWLNGTSANFSENVRAENITALEHLYGNLSWDNLSDHPVPCPLGTHIEALGDSITCTAPDSNNLTNRIWNRSGPNIFPNNLGDNLNITGNFTGNKFYGEIWNYSSNASAWTFSLPTLGIYFNLTGLFSERLNGFSVTYQTQANGGTYLTALVAGRYKIDGAFSFEGVNNNQLYSISIAKNYLQSSSRNCYSRRYVSTQAIVASSTITCILDLAVGDTINVQFENENSNKDVKIHQINVNLLRVGT